MTFLLLYLWSDVKWGKDIFLLFFDSTQYQPSEWFHPITLSQFIMPRTRMHLDSSISTPAITPVILCGGSGTRLWPLSRQSFPKQFVPLIEGESLLTLTAKRLKSLSQHLIFVAAEDHRFLIQQDLQGLVKWTPNLGQQFK